MPVKTKSAIKKEEASVETSTVSNTSNILSSYQEHVVRGIRACVQMNESVVLIGETGTGKTTLINALAEEEGKKLHRVSVNGSMGVDEILGKWLAKDGSTYWVDGILTGAVRKGEWVVFDELNAMLPEMGFALHSLLDDARTITLAEKDGETIKAHDSFRFFGSMNPSDDYAGTKEVNLALMSRFAGVFHIDVFAPDKETEVLQRNKIEKDTSHKLVNLAVKLRDLKKKGDMSTFVSTRDIIQAGKLTTAGVSFEEAVTFAVLNKLTTDEREELNKTPFISAITTSLPVPKELKEAKEQIKKSTDLANSLKKELEAEKALKNTLANELAELKKNPLSALGGGAIDPKTLQLLKTLGVIK